MTKLVPYFKCLATVIFLYSTCDTAKANGAEACKKMVFAAFFEGSKEEIGNFEKQKLALQSKRERAENRLGNFSDFSNFAPRLTSQSELDQLKQRYLVTELDSTASSLHKSQARAQYDELKASLAIELLDNSVQMAALKEKESKAYEKLSKLVTHMSSIDVIELYDEQVKSIPASEGSLGSESRSSSRQRHKIDKLFSIMFARKLEQEANELVDSKFNSDIGGGEFESIHTLLSRLRHSNPDSYQRFNSAQLYKNYLKTLLEPNLSEDLSAAKNQAQAIHNLVESIFGLKVQDSDQITPSNFILSSDGVSFLQKVATKSSDWQKRVADLDSGSQEVSQDPWGEILGTTLSAKISDELDKLKETMQQNQIAGLWSKLIDSYQLAIFESYRLGDKGALNTLLNGLRSIKSIKGNAFAEDPNPIHVFTRKLVGEGSGDFAERVLLNPILGKEALALHDFYIALGYAPNVKDGWFSKYLEVVARDYNRGKRLDQFVSSLFARILKKDLSVFEREYFQNLVSSSGLKTFDRNEEVLSSIKQIVGNDYSMAFLRENIFDINRELFYSKLMDSSQKKMSGRRH